MLCYDHGCSVLSHQAIEYSLRLTRVFFLPTVTTTAPQTRQGPSDTRAAGSIHRALIAECPNKGVSAIPTNHTHNYSTFTDHTYQLYYWSHPSITPTRALKPRAWRSSSGELWAPRCRRRRKCPSPECCYIRKY